VKAIKIASRRRRRTKIILSCINGPPIPPRLPISAYYSNFVGTVLNESANGLNHPEYEAMNEKKRKRASSFLRRAARPQKSESFHDSHPAENRSTFIPA